MKPSIILLIRSIAVSLLVLLPPSTLVSHAGVPIDVFTNVVVPADCDDDFNVTPPTGRTIVAGTSSPHDFYQVHINPKVFPGEVELSVAGLPNGATWWSENNGQGNPVKLWITATCGTSPGDYTITVTATSGDVTKRCRVQLTIKAGSGGGFSLSASAQEPSEIEPGKAASFDVSGVFTGCFTGPVDLSVDESTLPEGVGWSFSKYTIKKGDVSTLTFTTTEKTPTGKHEITILGKNNEIGEKSKKIMLNVIGGGGFSLTVSAQDPSSIEPGGRPAKFTIAGVFTGSFTGPVYLSVDESTLPEGVECSFDKNPLYKNDISKLTIKTTEKTPAGDHKIKIYGKNEGIGTKYTTAILVVRNEPEKFYLSAGPQAPPEIKPGEKATFKISAHNFFVEPVHFSIKMPLPDGVKDAALDPAWLPAYTDHDWVTLTVKTDSTIKEGSYNITVKGVCGDKSDNVAVTLVIGKSPESATLSVDKSVVPNAAKVGGMLLYTVRIENNGRGALNGVVVRDALPAGVGYVKGSAVLNGKKIPDPSGSTTLLWEIGDLPGGETITLKYQGVVRPNISRGRSTNTVVVTGTDPTGRTLTAKDSADIGVSGETLERKGKIKGRVFIDENKNGLKNVDEEEVAGIWVILEDGQRTRTDEEGLFTFDEIDSGEHLVGLDLRKLPKEYYVIGDASKIVSLFSGGTGRTYFGLGRTGPSKKELEEMRKAEEEKKRKEEEARKEEEKKKEEELKKKEEEKKPKGSITGYVFLDVNKNGRMDAWERGIEGIGVLLDGSKRVLSDSQGYYRFSGVPVGSHTVSLSISRELSSRLTKKGDGKIAVSLTNPNSYRVDLPVIEAGELKIEIQLKNR